MCPNSLYLPCTGGVTGCTPVFATALAVARRSRQPIWPSCMSVLTSASSSPRWLHAGEIGVVSGVGDTMERAWSGTPISTSTPSSGDGANCACVSLDHWPVRDGPPFEGSRRSGSPRSSGARLPPTGVAEHGRIADLIVAGRVREDGGTAMDVLEAALMNTGRPVLIAPPVVPASVGRIVTIAWRDTREAAGAVSAASPFIAQAERVIILTVDEDDEADDRSPERLQGALRWHNPNVLINRLVREHGSAAEVLLQAATQAGSDLLVTGGYSHTRLRQAMFGGFTRHVLEHGELPVLMAH